MRSKCLLLVLLLILACGCVLVSCREQPSPADPPAHEHAYGAWSETNAPTCVAKGLQTRSCACGATDTREVAATGEHNYGEDGLCTVCGAGDSAHEPQEPDGEVIVDTSNPALGGDSIRY